MQMRRNVVTWALVCMSPLVVLGLPGELLADEQPEPCYEEDKNVSCSRGQATFLRLLAEEERSIASVTPPTTDVIHCFLDLELIFSSQTVVGTNTLTIKSLTDGLSNISLDLRDNMVVDSVRMGGASVPYSRPDHKIDITLDRAYAANETFTVAVEYHGQPDSLGWRSFYFTSTVASSLSQPWYAHTWWPCKDELDDKFTMDFWITVPSNRIAAANGSLQGMDVLSGSRHRYRWRESYPIITYLVSVAAADYVRWTQYYEHASGSMPVEFFIYPESQATAEANTAHLITAIATYSRPDVFGEYPFINEKYGIAQFSGSVNMEHQTITSHRAFDPDIVNHELAHQWWGDMITCGTWHDIWLNEGFATYAEAIYHEKKPGGSHLAYMDRMFYRRPSGYSGSVYVYDISLQSDVFNNNLVYCKAAWVLHMLRHVVGDQTFFDILAAYRAAYEGGSAVTEDFKQVAELVHGRDLTWFFNQWIYGSGAPEYTYGWETTMVGGQRYLHLKICQVQTQYPLFRMPIDVTVTTPSGSTTHVVWQVFECNWYEIPVDGEVSAVTLDKDSWILRPEIGTEEYSPMPEFRLQITSPLPGTVATPVWNVNEIQLQFTLPPEFENSDFTVSGSVHGPQTFTAVRDPEDPCRVRLAFPGNLQGQQTWTVNISDTITAQQTGMPLDGEIAYPTHPAGLPSGDGVPGGSGVFSFFVGVRGDFDLDCDVDVEDFGLLQRCLTEHGTPPIIPACFAADLDSDGDVDQSDAAQFLPLLTGPNGQSCD